MSETAKNLQFTTDSKKDEKDKKEEKQSQDQQSELLFQCRKNYVPEAYQALLRENLANLRKYDDGLQVFKVPHEDNCPFKEAYLPWIVEEVNRSKNITAVEIMCLSDKLSLTDLGVSYLVRYLSDRITMFYFSLKYSRGAAIVGNESLKALAQRKTLKALHLEHCQFDDKGIEALVRCESLECLEITGCLGVTPDCGLLLAQAKNLKLLHMSDGFFCDKPSWEYYLNEHFIENLSASKSLCALDFSRTYCSDKLVDFLIKMPNLITIKLTNAYLSDAAKKKLREAEGKVIAIDRAGAVRVAQHQPK